MAREKLSDEMKQGKINEYLQGKEQTIVDKFNSKQTVDDKYQYMLRLIRVAKPKAKVEEATSDSSTESITLALSTMLRKKIATNELTKLKANLEAAITAIDSKIEGNRKADDIIKLETAITAMEAAGLVATEAKAKLEELKK